MHELTLFDRIAVIQETNKQYDLESNAYISFSGGKDSTVLHHLVDMALPGNKIPRVFINTGIEYNYIVEFVKDLAKNDDRFIILNPTKPIKKVLEENGYPFKSKQHSHNLEVYQRNGMTKTNIQYLGLGSKTQFLCPNCLKYQFSKDFKIKISDKCCYKMKKEPAHKWSTENNKTITMTGMRSDEGGMRNYQHNCAVYDGKNLIKFHPLKPISNEFEDWLIKEYKIQLCKLYYPPFNFQRTGCKGCPYSLDLQNQLDVMEQLLPNERKQCEIIWKPIYDEYRRLGYRLKQYKETSLEDLLKEDLEE